MNLADVSSPNRWPDRGVAIVLAAGASTRMGRCKALLPWQGETLLSYQIRQWLGIGVWPLVVLGPHNVAAARPHLLEQTAVINPHPELGKTESIQLGLRHLPRDWDWVAISAVDQPRPGWVYQRLRASHTLTPARITVPIHHDRMGHPVLFRADLTADLMQIQEQTWGLRQVMETYRSEIQRVPIADPVVWADLNTPQRYQEEQQRWSETDRVGESVP